MTTTLSYYDENANKYISSTFSVDFSETQDMFLKRLPKTAHILDFACGSGRDSKYFLDKGYKVTAIDGSIEMCKQASKLTGLEVKQMLFQDLEDIERYDAIWACASILHLKSEEILDVLKLMERALKRKGIIYISFKYGDFEGERNGRYFTDMTEESFGKILKEIPKLRIEKQWITSDVRPKRQEEKWLNLILLKEDDHGF